MTKETPKLKTWIELSEKNLRHNLSAMRSLLPHNGKIWAVIKSNAYGHGLSHMADLLKDKVEGFCVDSVIEGLKLRKQEIKNPILVIGPSIDEMLPMAGQENITISVSNLDTLESIAQLKQKGLTPNFHLKVDTGMHRQGFYPADLKRVFKKIKKEELPLKGIYSHFAAAKDPVYPSYSKDQFQQFQITVTLAEAEGFTKLEKHIAATPGLMLSSDYALDFARIGTGLYGIYPSRELEMHMHNLDLQQVLSWHTRISEIKEVEKDDYVGYDLGYRAPEKKKLAVIPVGYWHGIDRRLSNQGYVLVANSKAQIIGRVAMDITIIDITGLKAAVGDKVTILGKQGKEDVTIWDHARISNTSPQEIMVGINPLIKKEIE